MALSNRTIHDLVADDPRSITEIAYSAKISVHYLDALKHGKRANPSIAILERLARVLGVPVDDLFDHEEVA